MKISLLAATLLQSLLLTAQGPAIHIDAAKPGAAISKNLFGIFFEEINHAGEGGIYAELIRNRGFEENRTPEDLTRKGDFVYSNQGWKHYYKQPDSLAGWSLATSGSAHAAIVQTTENPLNASNPNAMRVEVHTLAGGRVEVSNAGFWGIGVEKDASYKLSLYARCNSQYKGGIKVKLVGATGQLLASAELSGFGANWAQYACTLTASASDTKATFVIEPLSEGNIWFDMVSLFPEKTFKARTNGMRNDLATLIDNFKPGFIRFPGGCIVEGADLENRVIWKNTIGDIAKRPGHWVLWDYHSTDGLGFHEFLQFCDDLGSPAMYVVAVGVSCQFRNCEFVSADNLQPYIDETLEALEYALGPVTTKWGAERAKNGHPAPFNVKYIEIGNENYGPIYQEHYNYFYKAIKAKYPQLQTITCTDPGMRGAFKRTDLAGITENIENIDEHFYESTDFFYRNAYRYDTYDRKGPNIYCGEYAVKKWDNSLRGNLDAALAEAAFMTGFERNADIVKMSSQAPTFINDNDRTWNPDLLVFNSSKAFGNTSYQVQKLFSTHIPDRVLPTVVEQSGYKVNPVEKGVGMIGFNNFGAACNYKDIEVTLNGKTYTAQQALTAESLAAMGSEGWAVGKTNYTELKIKPELYAAAGNNGWNNYTLSLKAKADTIDDLEGFSVLFYTTGANKHYKWNIGRWHRYNWLQWYDNGYESYFGQQPGTLTTGHWYNISITYRNDSVYCMLDGQLIHAVKAPDKVTPGIYATSGINNNGDIVLKVVNPTDTEMTLPVSISNAAVAYKQAHAETIAGERLDENTFDNPLKVSPAASNTETGGNNFTYTFKARSVTVLTLKP